MTDIAMENPPILMDFDDDQKFGAKNPSMDWINVDNEIPWDCEKKNYNIPSGSFTVRHGKSPFLRTVNRCYFYGPSIPWRC
jgi:hypothetical protein